MLIERTEIADVLLITPPRFRDTRGFFCESWNGKALEKAGVRLPAFVQDNHSMSHAAGTLRGLHFQAPPHAQGKLVRCGRGRLLDVAVDIRRGAPSYGKWVARELSFENGAQLWIPAGFLHGFVTLTPQTEVIYKCTDYYDPTCDGAVRWDSAGVNWGLSRAPLVSEKDAAAPPFARFESPFALEGAL